jgi:hypothetical protein
MRFALLLAACLCGGSLAGHAAAAPPAISGSYLINWSEFCSAQVGVQGSVSPTGLLSGLNIDSNGSAEQGIGTMTFTPAAASAVAGKFAINGWQSLGSLAVIQGLPGGSYSGTAIPAPSKMVISGTYKVTATTMTITITSETPHQTQVFQMLFSPATGPAAHVELLGGTQGCTFHATGWSQ